MPRSRHCTVLSRRRGMASEGATSMRTRTTTCTRRYATARAVYAACARVRAAYMARRTAARTREVVVRYEPYARVLSAHEATLMTIQQEPARAARLCC